MRIFTLLLSTAIISSTSLSAATHSWRLSLKPQDTTTEQYVYPGTTPRLSAPLKAESAQVKWLPGTMESYETYDNGASWELAETHTYKYENGLLTVDQSESQRITYTYDANGNWIEKLVENNEGDETQPKWTPSEKQVRAFDDVVPSFQTVREDWYWNPTTEQFVMGYKHMKIVTRDDAGRVQSVIIRSFANADVYMDIEGFRVLYDAAGNATNIILFELDDNYNLYSAVSYDNIVWKKCGQILNIEYLCIGDNLATSYDITENGELVGKCTTTYADSDLFACVKTISVLAEPMTSTYTYTETDQYGSYEETALESIEGETYGEKLAETFDQYGEQLSQLYYMNEGNDWILAESMYFDLTYDGAKLLEKIVRITDPESDAAVLIPVEKFVYSNHTQLGVTDAALTTILPVYDRASMTICLAAGDPAAYTLCSLDGRIIASGTATTVSTAALSHGLYILKTATATLKFVK